MLVVQELARQVKLKPSWRGPRERIPRVLRPESAVVALTTREGHFFVSTSLAPCTKQVSEKVFGIPNRFPGPSKARVGARDRMLRGLSL